MVLQIPPTGTFIVQASVCLRLLHDSSQLGGEAHSLGRQEQGNTDACLYTHTQHERHRLRPFRGEPSKNMI